MALKYTPKDLSLRKKKTNPRKKYEESVDEVVGKIYEELEVISENTETVQELILDDVDNTTTSIAIYGVNIVNTATTSDLATRLPTAVTGRQTVFINNSTMSILVFPSTVGGEINGVVDGFASIPNDNKAYVFYCTENPLPGAWTWTPPAIGQFQLPDRISVSHTNGVQTRAWGVGVSGAQLINPPGPSWYDDISISGSLALTFVPNQDYWATSNLSPERTLVRTKVYSNFLASDGVNLPTIGRYVAYGNGAGMNNYTASGVNLSGGDTVPSGPLNSPVEIGDVGTLYKIEPANIIQVNPFQTDSIGIGSFTNYYFTFNIVIHPTCITKVYEFDIFLEHT